MNRTRLLPNRRQLLAGAAATAALAAPAVLRAQSGAAEGRRDTAALGLRGRHRPGLPARCRYRAGNPQVPGPARTQDHERRHRSNVDTARERAEKLVSDGAQLLIGAFDSGQTTAVAQVAEQKGIPLVINVGSAPEITEQGYKFVVRNFPTVPMLLNDELRRTNGRFRYCRRCAEDRRVHACQRPVRHRHVERHPWTDAEI